MRILIISDKGDAMGLAVRLMKEGNEVLIYFKDATYRRSLYGLIEQVRSIPLGLQLAPDFIVFDMVGFGKLADELKAMGHKVIGAGSWNDRLELDRAFAMKAMDSFGIQKPASFSFPNLEAAAKFAANHSRKLVLKPHGNWDASHTYIGENNEDLISQIGYMRKELKLDGEVLLQEFVSGIEVSTEVWFADGQPVPMPNSTFETKNFLHGNAGPSTGCQTSVVFAYHRKEPRIVQQSIKKMYPLLAKLKYSGPVDINGIVRKGRFYGLEFTPRLGYNAIYALLRILDEPLGQMLKRIADGDPSPIKFKSGFGFSLRTTIPPYPFKPAKKELARQLYAETRGHRVGGVNPQDWGESVMPLDIYASESGDYYTAGTDGVILECTGFGLSILEAQAEAQWQFRKLELPNKQARLDDGGPIAYSRMMELGSQGYEIPPFERREKNETIQVVVPGNFSTDIAERPSL